ncbi:bifunctional diaminohydroxyphosphoribosylaminopyrimidine deaminase/5-amino-6-(5-phosphoribosylamino)uracil reductase RibD [Helicobacter sp. 11S02596-1]|uniref:bifunctional diaminohydroxyphosphoribosylaminopyrimidine deaminase/5-amino-6-(5-phosphoribosylamino)uracil reductase RibD n=1 Tax=Helicobacter sp. 11S02596-1 TaxID=1476194 RepID=UPI000BA6C1EE|nr:bifunctional diaminohydroxyphosphoribosylaminopyrimidine deaminase/5-amino-6-(5-phosphoribosylamino)uracil reductase RibD [Helicobacter sp. 11S02596-1]PAF44811.1 riboflavin biosynthesis protein RibD [Helicobacter sp. 11S02596-1]
MLNDTKLMALCLQEAWKYQTLPLPNPAVAAMVIGENGEILSICAHTKSGEAHAEVSAIKIAYEALTNEVCPEGEASALHSFLAKNHRGIFRNCSIYVTLEPCNHYGKTPPCAELLEIIKPKRVIIGATETQGNAQGGAKRLANAGIEVCFGVAEKECNDLLYPFLCLKKTGHFNLFKIAMRLDGNYQSGVISGALSREFTHNQRRVANALIVSGKTFREDRPLLDCRYASNNDGKNAPPDGLRNAPDVRVLTSQTGFDGIHEGGRNDKFGGFDTSIPAFGVPGREIRICHQISELGLERGFNIIEGGWGLFESLAPSIDMVLVHYSPTLKPNARDILMAGFAWDGELVYTQPLGNDALLWIKKS